MQTTLEQAMELLNKQSALIDKLEAANKNLISIAKRAVDLIRVCDERCHTLQKMVDEQDKYINIMQSARCGLRV